MILLPRNPHNKASRAKIFHASAAKEKPIYLVLAAFAVLVVVGGVLVSPYTGGPTGAQTASCGIETITSGPMGEVRSVVQSGGASPTCSITACTPGRYQASSSVAEKYMDDDGLVQKYNIQKICLNATFARTFGCSSTAISSEVNACNPSATLNSGEKSIGTLSDLFNSRTISGTLVWDQNVYQLIAKGVSSGSIQSIEWSGSFSPQAVCPSGKLYAGSFHEIHFKEQEFYRKYNICLEPAPPAPPTGLATTVSPSGALKVDLTWVAPTDNGAISLKSYNIYRSDSPGGAATKIGNSISTTYSDSTPSKGQTYYYTVKAVNNADLEGTASNEVSATTPDVPGATTGLAGTGGIGKVDLSWTAPAGNGGSAITCYKVFRSASQTGTYTLLTGTETAGDCANSPVGTTYTDNSASAGTTYYYKTAAMNAVGLGAQSSFASATVHNVPAAINNLAATAGTKKIDLAWTGPNNGGSQIICYKVFRRLAGDPNLPFNFLSSPISFVSCVPSDPITSSYTDNTVSEKQTYEYLVKAMNAVGLSPDSNTPQARVPDTTPPTVLSASLTNNTENLRIDLPYVMLNFSEPLSTTTITASTIIISPVVQHTRALEPSGKDVRITLSENLTYGKTYTLTAGMGVKDLENNALTSDYKLLFTTVTDATTLIVLESTMQNNSVNVSAVLPEVSITFNKEIDPATDTAIAISPSVNFVKQWSTDKKTLNLSFSSLFAYDTNYKLTVAKTLKDIYGFSPPSVYTIVFGTEPATMVEAASIENNTADIAVDIGNLALTFNRAINASTDSAITIFPKVDLTKQWSEDGKTLTISFAKNLDYKTDYKLTISTSLKDYLGINLAAPYRLSFKSVLPTTTTTQPSITATTAGGTATTSIRETTTTVAGRPGGISASEALAAIQEANLAIQTSEGKKDVSAAKTLYSQAVEAYSKSNYENAKTLALQAKTAIKELTPKEEFPILYVSIAAIIILLLATGGVYIYLKKNQAKAPEKKPEAPPAETPSTPSQAKR